VDIVIVYRDCVSTVCDKSRYTMGTLILIFPCFGNFDSSCFGYFDFNFPMLWRLWFWFFICNFDFDFSFATLILIFHALATFDFSLELCQGKATRNPYNWFMDCEFKIISLGEFWWGIL